MQLTPASLDRYRFYLRHLLLWAGEKDFKAVQDIRPTLPSYLASLPGKDGKGTLAGATQKKILDTSKRFYRWAKVTYPREMNNLPLVWNDTIRMIRQPQATAENVFVSEDEVRQLIAYPVAQDDLALLRDQAAAALLFLSGMRGGAFVTLPIAALDLENRTVRQWPELGVHTKNSKKASTFLLNIPDLLVPVRRWDAIVRPVLPPTTPWYAPIGHCWGEQSLSNEEPGKWRLNGLEKRLKLLFSLANLEFKSPHKFRHGHAVFGLLHAQTMADYKAVSMNLMHESIEVTDSIYAPILHSDVQERIANLAEKVESMPDRGASLVDNELESFLNSLDRKSQKHALIYIAERLAK
jgi:integrase